MRKLYKAEFFDRQLNYLDMRPVTGGDIGFDYLTLDAATFTTSGILIDKGAFCNVTDEQNNVLMQGIVTATAQGVGVTEISVQPLLALLDITGKTQQAETVEGIIEAMVVAAYAQSGDSLQNLPNVSVSVNSGTQYILPPDGATIALWEFCVLALQNYGIAVSAQMDAAAKAIQFSIGVIEGMKTIEADLKNVAEKNIMLGDSFGTLNKATYYMQITDGEAGQEQSVTYYRHTDGSIDTENEDRMEPVFFTEKVIEVKTAEEFAERAQAQAVQDLAPQGYQNLIELTLRRGDALIDADALQIGQTVEIIVDGAVYNSIYTGWERSGDALKLIFGCLRMDLTKILGMERRSNNWR